MVKVVKVMKVVRRWRWCLVSNLGAALDADSVVVHPAARAVVADLDASAVLGPLIEVAVDELHGGAGRGDPAHL